MPRPNQEQAEARAWRKATDEHAAQMVRGAITVAGTLGVRNVDDVGGHVVEITGPDGQPRRYFVRLTEVRT